MSLFYELQHSYTMTVFPSVSEISGNIVYNSQQTISLSCQVAAYPQPTIVWAFKTETKIWNMLNTSRISVHSTYLTIEDGRPFSRSRLAINNANSNDSGDYLCFATAANNHITVQSRAHSITVASKQCTQLCSLLLNSFPIFRDK